MIGDGAFHNTKNNLSIVLWRRLRNTGAEGTTGF
jgi:hypothetical protein